MNIAQFIDNELLPQLRSMVKHGAGYLAYGQIACGIEFLGACKDAHPFDESGHSKSRFERGIADYMSKVDARYAAYNATNSPHYLYKNLRCGMAHIIRPHGKIGFMGAGSAASKGWKHLEKPAGHEVVIFTIEAFLDDFEKACQLLKKDLPTLTDPKLAADYLPVSQV